MNSPARKCPSVQRLERYLSSSLELSEVATVENHVEDCQNCEDTLKSLLDSGSFLLIAEPILNSGSGLSGGTQNSRYENLERLGSGGFGTIWKMRDTKLNRLVAVKVMKPERASNPTLVRRFLAEAQICSQLSHPFIVPIHDMGLLPDGRPYFAMKLIEGKRLDEAFPPSSGMMEKTSAFASLCQAVAHAHERGVIHRDLKPQNVMVGAHGEIQLIDWGLAKAINQPDFDSESRVSESFRLQQDQTQAALGTLAYMPPEQFEDASTADKRSDVFSLGAILCTLLTGKPPYVGDADSVFAAASTAKLELAVQRLKNISVDPRLADIAIDCLAADVSQRPQSAEILSNRIQTLLSTFDQEAEQQRVALVEMETRQQEFQKRTRLRWAVATIVLLASLVIGGTLWSRSVDLQARKLQAIELANSAEKEFESGNFSDGLKQIALAMNASAGERDRLSKLADDIKLCQRLNEVFQQQAAAQAIRHMGIVVSTREQDAVKRRALEQYGDLLSDMESLRRRFATSPGKSWLAAALGSRAWLTNQFYPDDQAMVENCLEMARELDSNNEINMFLYDSANWNAPATVADKLKSDVNGKASQGALNLATEILIRGNVDPSIIREIVAQRRDNFGVNLRWSSKLAYRDSATGLQFAQVAASLRPDSALARLNLATLLWVNSDIQGALRECKKVLQQNSKDVRAQILLADLLQESDQNELAAATYKRAIELGSDDQDVIPLVKLGNLLGRDDRQSEAAMEKFNQALKIDPNCAFALYHKGQRLDESGKPEEAIALYKQALLLRPSYSFVHNNLGKSLISLYIKKRNTDLSGAIAFRDEAQSHFLAATRIDPENVWAHTNLGNTYNDQGKVKEALACFSSALSLDPKHPGAGFNLANTLLDDGQFAEALEAAKIFIQYYPENANAWFIAGIAESSLQRFGSALKSLKRSIKLADAQGRPAIGQTKMIEELQGMIGLEDKFADSVADAMIESIDPELAAKLLTRKGLTRTSFLTLKKAIESDDKFKTPRISLRAARFGVAAAVAAPSDELAHQYLFEAAELFTQCLTLVENGFEEDFTAEQFLVNVRMTIVDAVQRDALNNYPEQVRTAWLKIHDSLDAMKGD